MTMNPDETEIQQAIENWIAALRAKDLDRMMRDYDESAVLFDVKPPFQTKGAAAVRQVWEEALPCFPEKFDYERRDVRLIVGSDVAVAHWLFHLVGWPDEHPAAQMWMRATVVFRKVESRWLAVHEHVSLPFNPMNGMMVLSPDEDADRGSVCASAG